ncbi:DUF2254 domain-containing protein [Sphingopyxis sp.]|uniref:DUF2254 domain-containing protein n=1 Tax=Sphingopyxis sp. TaxID=1908224 RepID=UPI001D61D8E8|nr:DUF2254 domain-containing protein [Sphingopyxis sp.]MBW8295688.1 DUF2254 domain-containing protein [Sphingopyxis sp.]
MENIRSSYWFVPAIMATAALFLGAGSVYIDANIGSDWLDGLSWYQSNKADGAQQVLSTIAGSAITVAGVVFSITIASVSYAASQYGPRVLTNFMSDRGNQVTLGTFIATFLYCLVVLRTIRGGDDKEFVPDLAIIIALVLALCSIAVLIFFVHHVPRSIHVNTITAGIGRQLLHSVQERFPSFIGDSPDGSPVDETAIPEPLRAVGLTPALGVSSVRSAAIGYIEAIDDERLMAIATDSGLMLRLNCRPGDFMDTHSVYAMAWSNSTVAEDTLTDLQSTFAVSSKRTPIQDTRFLIDELVEVGTRALSPGVNDPFTAITCLDWLGTTLSEVARRQLPSPHRFDRCGNLRVIAPPLTFTGFVDRGLGQFRQYLATDKVACLHALQTIEGIAAACVLGAQIGTLLSEVEALRVTASEVLGARLFADVEAAAAETRSRLRSALADGAPA